MKKIGRLFSILMLCLLFIFVSGCGKKEDAKYSGGNGSTRTEGAPAQQAEGKADGGLQMNDMEKPKSSTSDNSSTTTDNRKVIKKSRLEIETKNFDAAIKFINERTDREAGYIESSNIYGGKSSDGNYVSNRTATFIIRIPKEKMNTFLKDAETLGVIVNRADTGEDVTSHYFDTEARVKTLKIQEDRLLAILAKSEKLSDVIELEKRLSEIRNEIESLTGTLKRYDNLVALATIEINVREVQTEVKLEPKPASFASKIADSFKNSVTALYNILKGLVLFIATLVPFLIVAGILFIPARFALKKVNKKSKELKIKDKDDNK